ncbi:MAG: 3-isopropylmalate dehydratase small subunit [Pseudomonadota bacterium]
MTGWTRAEGPVAVLPQENIDTDQLIPARFMSTPRSEGYGQFLLHDFLRNETAPKIEGAEVLIAGRNFGCGSSREAAVYALVDFGIRAVLAPSFGDIFASNAVNNGLLPAQIGDDLAARLLAQPPARMAVDIAAGILAFDDGEHPFALDETWRMKLIKGWDDIDMTAQHGAAIGAFAAQRRRAHAWAWPAATGTDTDLGTTGRGASG